MTAITIKQLVGIYTSSAEGPQEAKQRFSELSAQDRYALFREFRSSQATYKQKQDVVSLFQTIVGYEPKSPSEKISQILSYLNSTYQQDPLILDSNDTNQMGAMHMLDLCEGLDALESSLAWYQMEDIEKNKVALMFYSEELETSSGEVNEINAQIKETFMNIYDPRRSDTDFDGVFDCDDFSPLDKEGPHSVVSAKNVYQSLQERFKTLSTNQLDTSFYKPTYLESRGINQKVAMVVPILLLPTEADVDLTEITDQETEIERLYNKVYFPDEWKDFFEVDVQFYTNPDEVLQSSSATGYNIVFVTGFRGEGIRANSVQWSTKDSIDTHLHEIGHLLSWVDKYDNKDDASYEYRDHEYDSGWNYWVQGDLMGNHKFASYVSSSDVAKLALGAIKKADGSKFGKEQLKKEIAKAAAYRGEMDEAQKYYDNSHSLLESRFAGRKFFEGKVLFDSGKYDKAVKSFEEYITENKNKFWFEQIKCNVPEAYYYYALSLKRIGDHAKALGTMADAYYAASSKSDKEARLTDFEAFLNDFTKTEEEHLSDIRGPCSIALDLFKQDKTEQARSVIIATNNVLGDFIRWSGSGDVPDSFTRQALDYWDEFSIIFNGRNYAMALKDPIVAERFFAQTDQSSAVYWSESESYFMRSASQENDASLLVKAYEARRETLRLDSGYYYEEDFFTFWQNELSSFDADLLYEFYQKLQAQGVDVGYVLSKILLSQAVDEGRFDIIKAIEGSICSRQALNESDTALRTQVYGQLFQLATTASDPESATKEVYQEFMSGSIHLGDLFHHNQTEKLAQYALENEDLFVKEVKPMFELTEGFVPVGVLPAQTAFEEAMSRGDLDQAKIFIERYHDALELYASNFEALVEKNKNWFTPEERWYCRRAIKFCRLNCQIDLERMNARFGLKAGYHYAGGVYDYEELRSRTGDPPTNDLFYEKISDFFENKYKQSQEPEDLLRAAEMAYEAKSYQKARDDLYEYFKIEKVIPKGYNPADRLLELEIALHGDRNPRLVWERYQEYREFNPSINYDIKAAQYFEKKGKKKWAKEANKNSVHE